MCQPNFRRRVRPARLRASAINSLTFDTGSEGCATSTVCTVAKWVIGVKSLVD